MISYLQLWVRHTDGTARIECTERDDLHGRRAIDERGFALAGRDGIASVHVERSSRVAQTGRKSYR